MSATWLDSYSLAYTVASLLNQLFGKGKEPFWQQVYTNLVRWIIELCRVLPGGWVTLRDVYHCAIDKALFAKKIQQAQTYAVDLSDAWISLSAKDWTAHLADLNAFGFHLHPDAITYLTDRHIEHQIERTESTATMEIRLRVEAVNRWYVHDWNTLDNKIRSSIVEGVSVFLSRCSTCRPSRGCFARPRPRRGGCAARPNRGRPTTRATSCPRSPPPP